MVALCNIGASTTVVSLMQQGLGFRVQGSGLSLQNGNIALPEDPTDSGHEKHPLQTSPAHRCKVHLAKPVLGGTHYVEDLAVFRGPRILNKGLQ